MVGVIIPVEWSITPLGQVIKSSVSWASGDPATITVSFLDADGETKVWIFGRELLREAFMSGEAGQGDVRIRYDKSIVTATFSNDSQAVTLYTEASQIESFLSTIYTFVPEEKETYDIDDELERLLHE